MEAAERKEVGRGGREILQLHSPFLNPFCLDHIRLSGQTPAEAPRRCFRFFASLTASSYK